MQSVQLIVSDRVDAAEFVVVESVVSLFVAAKFVAGMLPTFCTGRPSAFRIPCGFVNDK